jgi:hypothetical protein
MAVYPNAPSADEPSGRLRMPGTQSRSEYALRHCEQYLGIPSTRTTQNSDVLKRRMRPECPLFSQLFHDLDRISDRISQVEHLHISVLQYLAQTDDPTSLNGLVKCLDLLNNEA